jgi:glycosidase
VYEINAWVWLRDLSAASGRPVSFATVPEAELQRLADHGFDGVWLMGVWRRSAGGRRVAREHPGLAEEFRRALPDYGPEDVVGSPYCVADYIVDDALGGDAGLADLRRRLDRLGLRLMLDFVPNHLAVDHHWTEAHPERLVQGAADVAAAEPGNYFFSHRRSGADDTRVFAHGRDPCFSGWTDTVQIDYRRPEARRAMAEILLSIAERCDGARCDMAMLVTREVFGRTWGGEFEPPRAEFWPAAITDLLARHPGFLTLAEVYWDMEWELQQQGFDYTYDKRLYDRLLSGDAAAVRAHLVADMAFQSRLARFVENHDERRAAEAFGLERSRAAAVLALTLPGFRLFHEGKLDGSRVKLPVQLGRRPAEEPVPGLAQFYRRLLAALSHPVFHDGHWRQLDPREARPGDDTHRHLVAHRWTHGDDCRIVVVNLAGDAARCLLPLDLPGLAGRGWRFRDLLGGAEWGHAGDELAGQGLRLDLPAHGHHVFDVRPAS